MAEQSKNLHEEGSNSAQIAGEVTPNLMESVMKELAELRNVNQKLNERLDSVLGHPKSKRSLFTKRKRSSVDPSCLVSLVKRSILHQGSHAP